MKTKRRIRYLSLVSVLVLLVTTMWPISLAIAWNPPERQITNTPEDEYEPHWSPDGSKIVYHKYSGIPGNVDIWVVNSDGSGQTPLLTGPSWDGEPDWSPDGTKIAFANNQGIAVVNADGSNQIQLTTGFGPNEKDPAWSPDGTKIAFSSPRAGEHDVWVMNANGTNLVNLTADVLTVNSTNPDWSPDGSKIVFTTSWYIVTMNADGSNKIGLAPDLGASTEPSWGARGKIAHVRPLYNIVYRNEDGSDPIQVTDTGWNWQPQWSPDGTKLAFISNRTGNYDIYIADIFNVDIEPVQVQATVDPTIELQINPTTLNFGNVNPSVGSYQQTKTATVKSNKDWQLLVRKTGDLTGASTGWIIPSSQLLFTSPAQTNAQFQTTDTLVNSGGKTAGTVTTITYNLTVTWNDEPDSYSAEHTYTAIQP